MTDTQDHQQKYSAGERIILGIELYDDNGIYDVRSLFVHSENPKVHITLYVEQQNASADDQGPQLKGWSFLPQGAVEVVEVSMIEWTKKRDKQLDTERQRELTAAR